MKNNESTLLGNTHKQLIEKRLSSRHVFDGTLLQVYVDDVQLPDKTESTRDWIKHPGASAIVPVFEDGTIMLLKQFRYPPRKIFIEVPAGKLDEGESPIETAKRELLEETGISCGAIEGAGSFFPAIGYADEEIHVFVAWQLESKLKNVDDDEFVINHRVSFAKAIDMISNGEITDAKTICSIIKAKIWWEIHEPFPINFS